MKEQGARLEKIAEIAKSHSKAIRYLNKSVDYTRDEVIEEALALILQEKEVFLLGVKNTESISPEIISKLKAHGFLFHTLDQIGEKGRAVYTQLINPLTARAMTGSSATTCIHVLQDINHIGIGTDGGGSVLAPALSCSLYAIMAKGMGLSVAKTKISTDGISFQAGIGEIGTSHNLVTPMKEKIFRACIIAHLETGKPLSTHTTLGTMGLWQVDLFRKNKVDMSKVVIGHCDLSADTEYHLKLADSGCFIAFDTIGKSNYQPEENRIKCLQNLISHGYLGQILVSEDLTRKSHLKNRGGIGYSYLLDTFLPMVYDAGISKEQVRVILEDNPRKFLDV